MYGSRAGRSLLQTRRLTSFFASTRADAGGAETADGTAPDFGPPHVPARTGVAVVGSMPYVTNYNVQVAGASLGQCRAAASALRAAHGVQLMALDHAGGMELGFNLQATEHADSPDPDKVLGWAVAELPDCARVRRAYVVGLAPGEARALAVRQLGMRRPTF